VTITLTPEHERIVQDELRSGHFGTVEEVIDHALHALKLHALFAGPAGKRDPKSAAKRIRERRKGVTLGGLKIKDLVNEGRR
jgi:hypothetical protein